MFGEVFSTMVSNVFFRAMVAPNDGQLQNFPLVPVRAYHRPTVTDSSQAFNATLVLYGMSVRNL